MAKSFMQQWGQPTEIVDEQINNSKSIVPNMAWQSSMPAMGANAPGNESGFMGGIMDGFLGETGPDGITKQGWGKPAMGAAQGLFNGWMGLQKLDMAKKQLKENKRQFEMNWGAQKKLTNSRLEDRQRRRSAANPEAQSSSEYMAKWGVN